MTPGRDEEFNADDAILAVIGDFERLSIALQDAILGLRHQPGSEATIASLERALEKARAGAQLARDLNSGNRERET